MSRDSHGNRLDDCGVCILLPTVTGTVRAEQAACPVHGTPPYAPLSAPPASSQALPADQDGARLLAILAAEPWLLHRPVECVNARCAEKWWCIGCDPDGDESCSASPWPCAIVRDKHPAYAAAYAAGEERGWHRGFDHARRYPAPTAAASSVPTGTPDCPSRFAARTGAVVGCRQRGRHLVHSNMAGATLDLVTWVDGDDDVIAISPGVPTGTRDPADRWWTHGSCGPAPGNADGPRWTSCVGCGKPASDLHWTPYPTPGNPSNGDDSDAR